MLRGCALRQIPLQRTEVKELLRNKQDDDDARVIKHLAGEDGIQLLNICGKQNL